MTERRQCEMPGCEKEHLVGWGSPPTWLCEAHFAAALKKAREVLAWWSGRPETNERGERR